MLLGSLGDDVIWGDTTAAGPDAPGTAGDTIYGGGGADAVWGTGRDDSLYGGTENDTFRSGAGNDRIYGIAGQNSLYGEDGNDTIAAGTGDDLLAGGVGDDLLAGDAGNDTLWGGEGNDTMIAGPGTDRMAGGAGADVFVFDAAALAGVGAAADTISDFNAAQGDVIDLSGLGLVFVGAAVFGGTGAGEVRYAGEVLQVDLDGNAVLNAEIVLLGAPALPGPALDLV